MRTRRWHHPGLHCCLADSCEVAAAAAAAAFAVVGTDTASAVDIGAAEGGTVAVAASWPAVDEEALKSWIGEIEGLL